MKILATIILLILAIIIMITAVSGCSPRFDRITEQDRQELNQLLEGI